MTIEATFWNASLISPRTCSFAALSMVFLCSVFPRLVARKANNPLDVQIERVARDDVVAWHHSSPQATSDARGRRRLLRRGLVCSGSVGCWLQVDAGRVLAHHARQITRLRP